MIKNDAQYNEVYQLRDEAKERLDAGIGVSRSGVHFELTHLLGTIGIRANGREDSVKKATQALEEYERQKWGVSSSEEKYLA
jgi:hypothetical protein